MVFVQVDGLIIADEQSGRDGFDQPPFGLRKQAFTVHDDDHSDGHFII